MLSICFLVGFFGILCLFVREEDCIITGLALIVACFIVIPVIDGYQSVNEAYEIERDQYLIVEKRKAIEEFKDPIVNGGSSLENLSQSKEYIIIKNDWIKSRQSFNGKIMDLKWKYTFNPFLRYMLFGCISVDESKLDEYIIK